MSADPTYRDYVLEQMQAVDADIRARAMFGGYGIYAGDTMFALITSDDELHLKVDDATRGRFEAAGSAPFGSMPYWSVPVEVLEDPEALAEWSHEAIDIATKGKRPR